MPKTKLTILSILTPQLLTPSTTYTINKLLTLSTKPTIPQNHPPSRPSLAINQLNLQYHQTILPCLTHFDDVRQLWLVRENTSRKRPKTRFLATAREEGVQRHHATAPSPLCHKPPTTRAPQRRTIRRDPTPAWAHTRRQQAPRGPAAQGSPSSPATNRR